MTTEGLQGPCLAASFHSQRKPHDEIIVIDRAIAGKMLLWQHSSRPLLGGCILAQHTTDDVDTELASAGLALPLLLRVAKDTGFRRKRGQTSGACSFLGMVVSSSAHPHGVT